MKTFKRICIKNVTVHSDGKEFQLKRATEYITSPLENGRVTVFSTFWITNVPIEFFAGSEPYTS